MIWEGPADRLTLTENAQPALMAVSLAAMRVLEAEAGADRRATRFVAGHSLGEYSALAAAGALDLGDTARLLRIRGRAMQQAVPVGAGAMAASSASRSRGEAVAAEAAASGDGVRELANDNSDGQVGWCRATASAVERAIRSQRRAAPSAPRCCCRSARRSTAR